MNQLLIITSIILFLLAYLVGVKKQTWLLSGYNQKRVRDQNKLARLVGSYSLVIGMVMFGGSFIDHPDTQVLFPIMIIGYVILLGYVNTRMVE
ncbi:DUF3784 domain-containing protein [Peribacillus simplex]|uniref:DUF3784 domain-containing protein n=1 Tax=Peribacillus TaxID=2675229 RepID=UPI0010BF58B4|nr:MULTISPECIES: DUF3784 domain-containing protein [Peribacillus]MDF1999067.1 DUF3784 domain-containing protein [Peribacillus frigoritolerans]TKG96163.1 DUF3784 domain-containing protein [Peribacillus simplex]